MGINLGSATPSSYRLGTATPSAIYLGSTKVWPVATGLSLAISRSNGGGVTSSFSGSGTSGSHYARAGLFYYDEANGLLYYSWTLSGSGTVYMSCRCTDETDSGQRFYYKKNGTTFATSNAGGDSTFASSATGTTGDVFTIVPGASSGAWSSQSIELVDIYAV